MAGFTDGKRFLKEIDGSAKLIVAVNVEIGQRKGKIISDYFVDKDLVRIMLITLLCVWTIASGLSC